MSTRKIGDFTLKGIGALPTIAAGAVIPSTDRLLLWDASASEGSRTKAILISELPALVGQANNSNSVLSVNGMVGAVTLTAESLGAAPATHSHSFANVAGLQAALDSKANSTHTHTFSDIGSLQAALDSKANSNHTHAAPDILGFQTALDGKANAVHSHEMTSVIGLQAALTTKQDASARLQEFVNGFGSASPLMVPRKKSDGSGVEWGAIAAGGNDPTQATKVEVGTHFLTDAGGLEFQQSDTGYYTYTQQVGRPGIIRCLTGGGATARTGYRVGSSSFLFGTGKPAALKAMVRLPTLSTSTNGFAAIIGFLTTHSGEQPNMATFRYTHDEAGGNWQLVCRQGWNESAMNCGIAPVAGGWQLLEIQVLGDGSQVIALINGSQVAALATNIPLVGSNQFVGAGFGLWKRVGVLDLSLDLDYFYATQDL